MTPVIAQPRGKSFDIGNMLRVVRTDDDAGEAGEAGADQEAVAAGDAGVVENEIITGSKNGDLAMPSTRKQDYPANDLKPSSKK